MTRWFRHCFVYFFQILTAYIISFALHAAPLKEATFAGGCFWCMEEAFHQVIGIQNAQVGYAGGQTPNPTYKEVSEGNTDHLEVVHIQYDPEVISYWQILKIYWANIDPTVKNRQFCDQGPQYQSTLFYHDEVQKKLALEFKEKVTPFLAPNQIYTKIRPFIGFYPADEYHQQYFLKNKILYKFYKASCKRKSRLKEVWKDFNFKQLYPPAPKR